MARQQTGDRRPARGPVRITTASSSPSEDIRARQRRYLVAMSFRTLCFVGAVFITVTWLRIFLVAAAVLLPYVAVVMANAGDAKSDGFALVNGASGTRELPGGSGSGADSGPDHL
jgi:hypothetical protein